MKEAVKEIFINALRNSKNDLIDKEDIKRLAEEFGLTFTKRAAKSKIVDKIIEEEKRLTYKIEELKDEIRKVKYERNKNYMEFITRYSYIFGTSDIFELKRIKREYDKFKENENK